MGILNLLGVGQPFGEATLYEYVTEVMNISPAFTERDGDVIFETDTGNIRMIGGWDGNWLPRTTTNEQWESSDGGVTFTQLANAPWDGRHSFAHGTRADGKFWIWGGDDLYGPQRDVWTFDTVNDWVQITSDWGNVAGNRAGHGFCVHNDYMYLIGGTIQDCVRSSDGITWTKMSDLSFGFSFIHGYCASHNGYIYAVGGQPGQQYKVFKSLDGTSWTALPDLPIGMAETTYWCRLISKWGVLVYIAGTGDIGNLFGVWVSSDDANTWKQMGSFPIRQSHARGVNSIGNYIYEIAGNAAPDSNRTRRVPYEVLADECVYSLRRTSSLYTGSAIRIVRAIDSAELDVGFVGNDLDTTAVTTFVGAGPGYIMKWYDQSINGHHLTQNILANMPKIYFGGLVTLNSKPAILFDSGTQTLTHGTEFNMDSHYVISAVHSVDAANRMICGSSLPNRYGLFFNGNTDIYHNNGDAQQFIGYCNVTTNTGTQYLSEIYRNRMLAKFYRDGVNMGFTFSTLQRYDTPWSLNKLGGEAIPFLGRIQELRIKKGVIEDGAEVAIQADINGYWGIY